VHNNSGYKIDIQKVMDRSGNEILVEEAIDYFDDDEERLKVKQ
jgi:hypothetical protein